MKLCFVVLALVVAVYGSSHSEAPGSARDPKSDISDFYAFQSYEPKRAGFTTMIMNTQPLQDPFAGPNYHALPDDVFFEFYVDNNGDGTEDITFQFQGGNRLGGGIGPVRQLHDFDECCRFGVDCTDRVVNKHEGVHLTIGPVGNQRTVAVPLKAVGAVTAGDNTQLNFHEYYNMYVIRGNRNSTRTIVTQSGSTNTRFTKPMDYAGTKTFPDYNAYARQYIYNVDIPGCTAGQGRVFVGQRRESFHIPLGKVFDLINLIPVPGFPNTIAECTDNDDLRRKNVLTFALEAPTSCLTTTVGGAVQPILGMWSGVREIHHTSQETFDAQGFPQGGGHVPGEQLSRKGMPLVNELVIGLKDKDRFNRQHPAQDADPTLGFGDYVTHPTFPELVNILFRTAVNAQLGVSLATLAPTVPRNDLVATFLTGITGVNKVAGSTFVGEMLRLNTAVALKHQCDQNALGVIGGDTAGYPNGRRPGDDVVDITMRVAMGKLYHLGLGLGNAADAPVGNVDLTDGAPTNAFDFDVSFPYLRTPLAGATTDPKAAQCKNVPLCDPCPHACTPNQVREVPPQGKAYFYPPTIRHEGGQLSNYDRFVNALNGFPKGA